MRLSILYLPALALLLETLRLSWLGRFPIAMDPLLAVVVIVGLVRKRPAGAAYGFLAGLLRDWLYGGPAGLNTLLFTSTGAAMGALGKTVYRDSFVTHAVMTGAALTGRGVVEYLASSGGSPAGLLPYVVRVVLPGMVITSLAVPGMYHAYLRWKQRRAALDLEALLEQGAEADTAGEPEAE